MPVLAMLDVDKVLLSLQTVAPEQWVDGAQQVRVPDSCDLKPGLYRWTGSEFRWVGATEITALNETKALARICQALIDIKQSAPATINYRPKVTNWLQDMAAVIAALKQD